MKSGTLMTGLLATVAVAAAGFGLYRAGMQHGMQHSLQHSGPMPGVTASSASAPVTATVDPSAWGIPEGEAATRRHIESGLKAGDVDPVTGRQVLHYHDPMVPGRKFDAPGKSPFMNMMLVPAYAGAAGADAGTISVSPRIRQNLGVRTAEVSEATLATEITAAGAVAWNEREQVLVQARAMGYVEKLHVRAAMERVATGQPLFDLYVPDWVAMQEEFLALRRMQGERIGPLLDAARQRMRQAGMSAAQIAQVERGNAVQARISLNAPIGGVLSALEVREGSTVMPGMTLARINGLSSVWVHAEVPESQIAGLRTGARVTAQSPALPGETFPGRVQALLPEIDPGTRTLRVRVELPNPGDRLRPGMFVRTRLELAATGKSLLIPSEALIHTGQRSLVMLAEDDGTFRPVEVGTGRETGDKTEILRGLQAGQRVVSSGQFLIDSEASLKGIEVRLAPSAPEAGKTQDSHRTRARIEAVDGDVLTLDHPPIPALRWPQMVMDFRLAPALPQAEWRSGQEVEVDFRMQEGDMPLITAIRRADGKGGAQ